MGKNLKPLILLGDCNLRKQILAMLPGIYIPAGGGGGRMVVGCAACRKEAATG
jgi:hypothetical protein